MNARARARIAIATLGCKVNYFDTTVIEEGLDPSLFDQVRFEDEAEIYVVNTCSVTSNADAQARNLIRRAKRRNPDAAVVVTGCYAQLRPKELAALSEVDRVLTLEDRPHLGGVLRELAEARPVSPLPIVDAAPAPQKRTRPVVKIQEGCDVYCSFCVIPYSRGDRKVSMPMDEVRRRLFELRDAGAREVILTGPYVGGYGEDLDPPTTLAKLLASLAELDLGMRIRLSSVQPTVMTDDLLHVLASSPVFCRHLHIPLQSGDDEVLRRMNRPYTGSEYRHLIEKVARRIDGVGIGVDVIVGHPGEDESAFARTKAILEDLPVSYLHVFPFSTRPITAAAKMKEDVSRPEAKRRGRELRDLDAAKRAAFARAQVGRRLDVLFEQEVAEPNGFLRGFSDNYLPVLVPAGASKLGEITSVRILEARAREARGVPATRR